MPKNNIRSRIEDLNKLNWLIINFLEVEIPQSIRGLHRMAAGFQKDYLGKSPKSPANFEKELPNDGYIKQHHVAVITDHNRIKHEKLLVLVDHKEVDPTKHDLSLFYRYPLEWKFKLLQGEYRVKFWNNFKENLTRFRKKGYVNDDPDWEKEKKRKGLELLFSWGPTTEFSLPMLNQGYGSLDLDKGIIKIPTWRDDTEARPNNLNYLISIIYDLPFNVFKQCECYNCEKWFVSHKKNKRFCNLAHQKKHNDWSLTHDPQKESMYFKKRLRQSRRLAPKKKG